MAKTGRAPTAPQIQEFPGHAAKRAKALAPIITDTALLTAGLDAPVKLKIPASALRFTGGQLPAIKPVKAGPLAKSVGPIERTARGFPMPADIRTGETLQAYVKRVGVDNVPVETRRALDMATFKSDKLKAFDAAAFGMTFTAMDMGRAVFQSDVWKGRDKSAIYPTDICSYITRVLFGRNLVMGRGPIRVDLENGHHLFITMRADLEDLVPPGGLYHQRTALAAVTKERDALAAERIQLRDALQDLVDMDTSERKTKTHGYSLHSPYAKMWDRARKLLGVVK